MTAKNEIDRALFLFAPKFREFGTDIANELVSRNICKYVDGICSGGNSIISKVEDGLKDAKGKIWDLEAIENDWINNNANSDILKRLEDELGNGIVGKIITSDRRIGSGWVTGGVPRPSWLAKKAKQNPIQIPLNYIAGLYQFLDKVLDDTNPKFVFSYGVASAHAFLLGQLCLSRDITFCRLISCRVGSRIMVDNDPMGCFKPVLSTIEEIKSGRLDAIKERQKAKQYLANYRKNPGRPEYYKFNLKKKLETGPVRQTCRAAKSIFFLLLKKRKKLNKYDNERIERIWFKAKIEWKRFLLPYSLFTENITQDYEVVYFPLQFEPEASTMVLCPWHTNQLAVIESLAKALPANCILAVKEHMSMLGNRPDYFYPTIAKMPRVMLIHPGQDGIKMIQNARLTVVISGTSAWEAVKLKKPVIVIGNSPFLGVQDGMIHEPCLSNLPSRLSMAMKLNPASDESVEIFLSALYMHSFEMKPSLLWGNYLEHNKQERVEAISSICDGIARRIND